MDSKGYCVWGLCESWEYCCGDNVCCNERDLTPILLTAIILGTLMVIGLCCSCFCCNARRSYTPLLKKYLSVYYATRTDSNGKTSTVINRDATSSSYMVQVDEA